MNFNTAVVALCLVCLGGVIAITTVGVTASRAYANETSEWAKKLGKLDGVASVYYFDDNEKGVRCYVRQNGSVLSCVKVQ